MKTVLTIAGSDSSGGAGIQADLKTIAAHGIYGMSAITALTAQNTTGVKSILESTPEFLEDQLDMIFEDIFPDAVKIGMVSSSALIEVIAKKLKQYQPKFIVLDPVMVATSGSSLTQDSAVIAMTEKLFPLATVITPNIPESETLVGYSIQNKEDMEKAAKEISEKYHVNAVLIKGGHAIEDADDYLYDGKGQWILGKRIENDNTHGTGCTLSSAIASSLALENDLLTSVKNAKEYISGALADGMNLGKGSGPLNHMYKIKR